MLPFFKKRCLPELKTRKMSSGVNEMFAVLQVVEGFILFIEITALKSTLPQSNIKHVNCF